MVKLINYTEDYNEIIEYASRMSTNTKTFKQKAEEKLFAGEVITSEEADKVYRKAKEESEKFVEGIARKGHLSLGRFAIAEFEITCSIDCLKQWTRHVFLSFCVRSGRYVDHEDIINIFPLLNYLSGNKKCLALSKMEKIIDDTKKVYKELIDIGVKKEDARCVLTGSTETRFCVASNLQGWTNFILLRTDNHAQEEIRNQALEIKEILLEKFPAWFKPILEKAEYEKELPKIVKRQKNIILELEKEINEKSKK